MTRTAIHKLLLCLYFALFTSAIAVSEIEIPVLPVDENEAISMLEEGTLDSSVWRKIELYYTMPIRVPQGELRIVQDLFPGLPEGLPCRPEELSEYKPWNDSAVQKFFSDFPELAPFSPILSFECGPAVSVPMNAGFYFSRRGAADTARQYTLFSIGDQAHIAASGRIDFTDAYGRWCRRSVSAAPAHGVRAACGNFSPRRRNTLFSGYFPSPENSRSDVSQSWLYGSSRTWNGAALTFANAAEGQEYEAFYHAGPAEQVGQVTGDFELSSGVSCHGGISYLRTMDAAGPVRNSGYFHAGMDFSLTRQWRGEFEGSVNFENITAFPWIACISHSSEGYSFKGTFTGLPHNYTAPRSETARLLRMRAKEDSVSGYLFNTDLQLRRRMTGFLTCSPRLSFLMNDNRPVYLLAGIELSGKAWCSYRFWYSWNPLFGETIISSRQQIMAACSYYLSKKIGIDCSDNFYLRSGGYWSNRIRISIPVQANQAIEFSPLFMMYQNQAGFLEKTAALGQRLKLYEKTFSDITFEQEIPFSSWRTVRARGKMSFFF